MYSSCSGRAGGIVADVNSIERFQINEEIN